MIDQRRIKCMNVCMYNKTTGSINFTMSLKLPDTVLEFHRVTRDKAMSVGTNNVTIKSNISHRNILGIYNVLSSGGAVITIIQ